MLAISLTEFETRGNTFRGINARVINKMFEIRINIYICVLIKWTLAWVWLLEQSTCFVPPMPLSVSAYYEDLFW